MKVTLFADMRAENWPSMNRYAESLSQQFRISNFEFQTFRVEPPLEYSRLRMFCRDQVYPRWARFYQGEVNHILDHSYAHLLNYLEPGKTVVTCHDLMPLEFEKDPRLREKFRQTVENLSKAAVTIADSQATRKDLVTLLNLPESEVEVIYLGVDPLFRPFDLLTQRQEAKRKFNLPEGRIVFSHGKSDLPYKNTEGIIESFAKVLFHEPKAYLLRVNPLTAEQKDLIKALGVESHYLEIKQPSDQDLVALYNSADVFVSPSFKEGFGFPVLQSLACGTPVVISPGGSLEEIAGDCGIYVNPRDADDIARGIRQVLEDGTLHLKNQSKMIERARLFSWEKTARETYLLYETIYKEQL